MHRRVREGRWEGEAEIVLKTFKQPRKAGVQHAERTRRTLRKSSNSFPKLNSRAGQRRARLRVHDKITKVAEEPDNRLSLKRRAVLTN